jgi:hypothetical protein
MSPVDDSCHSIAKAFIGKHFDRDCIVFQRPYITTFVDGNLRGDTYSRLLKISALVKIDRLIFGSSTSQIMATTTHLIA